MSTIINNLWQRLNILVPEPQCSTKNNDYDLIVWKDSRSKPTVTALKNVSYDPAAIEASNQARIDRDIALNSLDHDFGDGRVMQTRPKDESNIRNAIEVMNANNIPSIEWVMIDDIKYPATIADLQAALAAGQLAAMSIWNNYNP